MSVIHLPGAVCTFVGDPEVGHLAKPDEDQSKVRIRPVNVIGDGNGNIFFVDDDSRIVYFYNRSGSDMTLFGNTIRAGELYRVLGVGAYSNATSSASSNEFAVSQSYGLAFDNTRKMLYVADKNRHRVYRVNTSGLTEIIFGTGSNAASNNVDGAVATSHNCGEPYGLAVDESSDEVYVACNTRGVIKKISNASNATLSSITASVAVGVISGGNVQSGDVDNNASLGAGGTAKVRNPRGIAFFDDQLFIYDENDCQIKVANMSGSSRTYFGQTVNANSLKSIAGNGCGYTLGAVGSAKFNSDLGTSIGLHTSGASTLKGIFFTSYNNHRVGYLNNEGSAVTYGGNSINSNEYNVIWGTGSAQYNGDNLVGNIATVYRPTSAFYISSTDELLITDFDNERLRSLDLSTANGRTSLVAGSGQMRNFDNNQAFQKAYEAKFNRIGDVSIYGDYMYFSESVGAEVQKLNMKTGEVNSVAYRFK